MSRNWSEQFVVVLWLGEMVVRDAGLAEPRPISASDERREDLLVRETICFLLCGLG